MNRKMLKSSGLGISLEGLLMIVKLWSSHLLFGAVQSSVQCVVVLAGLRVSQVLKL